MSCVKAVYASIVELTEQDNYEDSGGRCILDYKSMVKHTSKIEKPMTEKFTPYVSYNASGYYEYTCTITATRPAPPFGA